jgi:hypothetical protein
VRLWTQKIVHTPQNGSIYDCGHPSTHFWFSFQVDLTPKSRAESNLVVGQRTKSALKMPLVHTKDWLNNASKICYKKRQWVNYIFKELICIFMLSIFSFGGSSFLVKSIQASLSFELFVPHLLSE